MTNNEKVKQAINKNMASIYSALEQVGATLPEKKNLENISITLQELKNFLIKQGNADLVEGLQLLEIHMHGNILNIDDMESINNNINYWVSIHLYGGKQ